MVRRSINPIMEVELEKGRRRRFKSTFRYERAVPVVCMIPKLQLVRKSICEKRVTFDQERLAD
jgi:hypothetical protein